MWESGRSELEFADMNGDGNIDIITIGDHGNPGIQSGEEGLMIYFGDGEGNWTADAAFSVGDPGSCKAFRVGGDADHNGKPDLVLLEETEISWFTYQNYMHFYKENSSPVALEIKAVYPRGHELLRPGSVRFLEWISAVPVNKSASQVTLAYSTTGPNGPWTTIASNVPDNGRCQWIVPQENISNCCIQYTLTSGDETIHGITPAAFTITNGTISIEDQNGQRPAFSVYPNPAVDQLAVGGQRSAVRIEIVDMYGSCGANYNKIAAFPFTIDISSLAPGMYLFRLSSEQGILLVTKFLKIEP